MFFKPKVSIHSIHIPDPGWERTKNESGIIQWINPEQTVALSINYFNIPPDIPAIADMDGLRKYYTNALSRQNGGIVNLETFGLRGVSFLKTVIKLPQVPSGLTYIASLTMPFETCSFVVKAQAAEVGPTGVRHAMLMESAEEEQHDAKFPDHPLSLARSLIGRVEREITWGPEIERLKQK